MSLKGAPEFRARLKAVRLTFKDYGRKWADETAVQARGRVPVKTGRLKGSIKRKSATQRRATVVAHYSANFVDAGTKAHDISAKRKPRLIFEGRSGDTIFAKKVNHPRTRAQRFKRASALAGLAKHPLKDALIERWNSAA